MRAAWISFVFLAGCATSEPVASAVAVPDAGGDATALDAAPADVGPSGLIVHEFGTFTSVQSSTGKPLAGMQHDEEQIPAFVQRRDFGPPGSGAQETLPEAVTQKLQTAAMYFYTAKPLAVDMAVKLPQGLLSAAFPGPFVHGPAPIAVKALAGGEMAWQLQVTPAQTSLAAVPAEALWSTLREVPKAATVKNGAQVERFLFYQGLARFQPPVAATADLVNEFPKNRTIVRNDSDEPIPAAFYVHIHAGGGQIMALGPIAAKSQVTVTPTPKELNADVYSGQASAMLQEALTKAGLDLPEAKALIASWSHNYFKTFGLRVLYIAPAGWVDAWLPVSLTPKPDQHVRTFVGRVEILLPDEEAATLATIQAASQQNDLGVLKSLGFFAEARVLRTLELTKDGAVQAFCDKLLQLAVKSK